MEVDNMERLRALLAIAFLFAGLGSAQAQAIDGKTPKGILYRYERVLRGEEVAVSFAWRIQALNETRFGSLIFYLVGGLTLGAGDDSKEVIERKLRELQVAWNPGLAGTSGGSVTFQRPKLDQVAALLAQMIQKPSYPQKEIEERYKKVVVPAREKFNREPLNQLQFAEFALNLPDFSDGMHWMAISEAETKPPSSESLRQLHQRVLGRNNLVVSVAGNLSEGDASSFVDRVFGGLPMVEAPPPSSEPTYRGVDKLVKIEREVPQVYVRLYGTIENDADPIRDTAIRIALSALANSKDSAVSKVVREELGAAYSTDSGRFPISPQTSLMVVTVQLDPEQAPLAIERLRQEYKKYLEHGMDEATVQREIDRWLPATDARQVTTLARATGNLNLLARGLPASAMNDTRKALGSILTAQINERIAEGLPKAVTAIAMAPARVAIKADCTIKSYAETAKCGF
jgi:predicted Zn-dependent peptidase